MQDNSSSNIATTQTVQGIVVTQLGGPEVLVYGTKELPITLDADEVLVAVKAVGVNPVDTYIRSGAFGRAPTLPYTPGSDGAGVVEAVGSGVTRLAVGDRVYLAGTVTGSYATKTIVKENQAQHLPDNVEFAQGACVYVPAGTAYQGIHLVGKAVAGEVLFIHGASGGVGIAAVQLGRAAGLTVIGTASTEEGRALVLKEGAHYVFDHKAEDYVDKVKALAEKLGGIDLILEMLANVNLNKDCDIIKPRGRIVIIGNRGSLDFNARAVMMKQIIVTGLMLYGSPQNELDRIFAGLHAALENKSLRPVVGKTIPLEQAAKAHHDIINSTHLGNIVLVP